MPTQGPSPPATAANVTFGTISWTNPDGAKAAGGSPASAVSAGGNTDWLSLTNFGFTVPGGATITDVSVTVNVRDTVGASPEGVIVLTKDGTTVSGGSVSGIIPGAYGDLIAGGDPVGYWATTLTAAEVNASTFGTMFRAASLASGNNVDVDYVTVTVTYTGGSATTSRLKLRKVG